MLRYFIVLITILFITYNICDSYKRIRRESHYLHNNLQDYLLQVKNKTINGSKNYTTKFSSLKNSSARDNKSYGSSINFYGKVVLVTGASGGIGKVIALHFSKLGATLSLTGSNFTKLYYDTYKSIRKIAKIKPQISRGDLTHSKLAESIVSYTISRFGKIDVLVNCAGAYEFGTIENTTVQQLDRLYKANVRSMYAVTIAALPHLKKTNGTIINVSSLAGLRPFSGILAYCMSKAAVDQFTKCLALELGRYGIRVNSVNPSLVDTGLHLKAGMDLIKYKKYVKKSKKKHILGRITTPDDVAKAVVFLASDDASFITGVNFPVDGGRSICTP